MDKIKQFIISNYSDLTDSERHIAKIILNRPNDIINSLNIADFAACCSVSESTIVRFAKKIGLNGFIELKTLIKIAPSDASSDKNLVNSICDNEIKLINYYRNFDFTPIINLILDSPTIYGYGTGRFQKAFVQEMQRLFIKADTWIRLIEGEDEFKTTTNLMNSGDTLIIVSSRGENATLKEYYDLLSIKNINIVSFTNSSSNSLVYESDYNIATDINSIKLNNEYYFDNISSMYVPLRLLAAQYTEKIII